MPIFAELEFRIGPRSAPGAPYPVSPRLWVNGQDVIFPDDQLKIDLDALFNLRSEYDKYDAALSQVFFQPGNVKDAFDKARSQLDQAGAGNRLRVRLLIEGDASELQHVRWECLRDVSGRPLFNGDTILFSRYLSSANLRPIGAKTQPKALVVIANPPHLDQAINPEDPQQGLPPVDVQGEKQRAATGLQTANFAVTTLALPPYGTSAATLENIVEELENGYDVFYLVCHGGLVPQTGGALKPMLWLEDGEDPVDAARLVEAIRNIAEQPRLVVLASCQSAGADGVSASASGTLGALGPLLADAGVPAVIAMQGNIKMTTIDRFLPQFFSELAKDGSIDRAMGKARGHILDCDDFWMPALFMRLSDGQIWSQPAVTPVNPALADPSLDIKSQAARLFSDLSTHTAVFPIAQVADSTAVPGEIKASAPGVWKAVSAGPNLLSYAILRAFGAGRILALGHEHMLTNQDAGGNNYFLDAAIAWLKDTRDSSVLISAKPGDTLFTHPTNLYNLPVMQNQFAARGFQADTTQSLSDPAMLAKAGLVVIANSWAAFTPPEIDAVTNFVKSGGGLLAGGLGWSWSGPLAKYPMNQLLQGFGASWTANRT